MNERFYIHNLRNPFDPENFIKKLCLGFDKNLNSTMIFNGSDDLRILPSSEFLLDHLIPN
jgi:hypothetical protein